MPENLPGEVRGDDPVLLSGASGLLGSALAAALQREGRRTLRLVRRVAAGGDEVEWNPGALHAVKDAGRLEGVSAAIHLSGANVAARRWDAAFRREMVSSRVASTEALARTLAGLRTPPRVLLAASAIGIYGDRSDEVLTEASPVGSGFFAELCHMWEEAAEPAAKAGIRVVHLRLGVVLARGGALARMAPIFRLGLGGKLGSGRQWMSWISLEDAVAAALFTLEHENLAGPFNVTSPNPATNAEFTRALAKVVHRPAVFPAPAFALRLAFGQMADEALLASARVLPARLQHAGFGFCHPELSGALAAALR